MITRYEDVLKRLMAVDAELRGVVAPDSPLPVTLIGGAAVIIYGGKRGSQDKDVISGGGGAIYGMGAIFERHGIHVVTDVLVNLHPDWADRVHPVSGATFSSLVVYVLDPYDLAIAKIARGTYRDIQDIQELAQRLAPDKLCALYREAMGYWVGRQENVEGALRYAIHTVFGKEA